MLHNIIERKNVSTQIKAMSKIRHTAVFEIKQRIDKLFALFSPEGEKLWVPGWDYENIMGTIDLHYPTSRYVFGAVDVKHYMDENIK